MIRAVIYAAKSTEDKKGSIATQIDDCEAMAEREGWEVLGTYSDEEASAYTGNRGPGLASAMEHAKDAAPSVLVVQHSDRLARGNWKQAQHLVQIVGWGVENEVTIRSVQDDLFADERMAILMGALMGQRNTEDSARKSKAVAAGMRRRIERGEYSGPRPYGYDFAADKTGLIVKRSEAAIVRRIFKEYAAGSSLTAIAKRLQGDNVPRATERGRYWRQSTVSGILRNTLYLGKVVHRGETFEGKHEAIVEEDLFERVAALLTAQKSKGRGRPRKASIYSEEACCVAQNAGRRWFREPALPTRSTRATVGRSSAKTSARRRRSVALGSTCRSIAISRPSASTLRRRSRRCSNGSRPRPQRSRRCLLPLRSSCRRLKVALRGSDVTTRTAHSSAMIG